LGRGLDWVTHRVHLPTPTMLGFCEGAKGHTAAPVISVPGAVMGRAAACDLELGNKTAPATSGPVTRVL